MDSALILKSIEAVTSKWTRQRKKEERGRARSRSAVFIPKYRMSIRYAASKVLPDAYLKVSGGGKLPTAARQLYYACRTQILKLTGRDKLDGQYFSQTILPQYIAAHPKDTASWDVVYDARGHFEEPHTRSITPLGTIDVRRYLTKIGAHTVKDIASSDFDDSCDTSFPTAGPAHRFGAVLFIEKEGFLPLFEATKLAERYDVAIMSTKGMPVVACRQLADQLCGRHGIPLLVLHDFDKSGFSIVGTLSGVVHYDQNYNERENRYDYRHEFQVIDLGLRLEDVQRYKLESEPVTYRSNPSGNLEENGATRDEIAFLCSDKQWKSYGGDRVELNAFTSDTFIKWIEGKLKAHGVKKVVPDSDTLTTAYKRAVQVDLIREQLDELVYQTAEQAEAAPIPKDLDRLVRKRLKRNSAMPWDEAVAELAAECGGANA